MRRRFSGGRRPFVFQTVTPAPPAATNQVIVGAGNNVIQGAGNNVVITP